MGTDTSCDAEGRASQERLECQGPGRTAEAQMRPTFAILVVSTMRRRRSRTAFRPPCEMPSDLSRSRRVMASRLRISPCCPRAVHVGKNTRAGVD